LAVSACNSDERAAKHLVRENLKNPDSAEFDKFSVSEQGTEACLGVNGT
jgi:hypothetical protein